MLFKINLSFNIIIFSYFPFIFNIYMLILIFIKIIVDFEKYIFSIAIIRYFYKKFQILRKSLYSILFMTINIKKNKLKLRIIYLILSNLWNDDLFVFFIVFQGFVEVNLINKLLSNLTLRFVSKFRNKFF